MIEQQVRGHRLDRDFAWRYYVKDYFQSAQAIDMAEVPHGEGRIVEVDGDKMAFGRAQEPFAVLLAAPRAGKVARL